MSDRQDSTVELKGPGADLVPATILGYNLEATEKTVRGMLSNRLENAKFIGPADANGFPPPWRASNDFFQAMRAEVDPGVSLAAGVGSSQLLLSYSEVENEEFPQAMLQTEREVRAGEELELVIWAKTRHKPTTLRLAIRPSALPAQPYATADVTVETPYWTCHSVTMKMPADDDHAVFYCGVVGTGLVWLDQVILRGVGEGHVAEQVVSRLERLRVPVLRFPGGCLASNYRWRYGTGPVEKRPGTLDTANHRNLNYDFGTDEYLELCLAQDIRPHITVNLGSGTPEEAGEWAAYVADWYRGNGVEPPLAYFQVGNEDNGIHEFSHMTGEMYADLLRAYVPEIRKGHPAARIIALAEPRGHTISSRNAPWRQAMLPAARELAIEVLVVHLYHLGRFEDEGEQLSHAFGEISHAAGELQQLLSDCREAGLDCAIGVTEWNYWTQASHWDGPTSYERSGATMAEPYAACHQVFAAGMVHNFARLAPDLELANFYQLINGMGVIKRRGLDVSDGPMASLFELYRPALPGKRVDVSAAVAGDDSAPLEALAIENEEGTWLFLVNGSAGSALTARVEGVEGPPAEIELLSAERPLAPLQPAPVPAWGTEGVELPPISVARLRWAP